MVTLCMEASAKHGGNNCERVGYDNITKAFKIEFELATMEANATTSLLNVTLDIEKYNEIKMETTPTKKILIIMEVQCLQQASAVTTSIATTSYTYTNSTRGVKQLIRK